MLPKACHPSALAAGVWGKEGEERVEGSVFVEGHLAPHLIGADGDVVLHTKPAVR